MHWSKGKYARTSNHSIRSLYCLHVHSVLRSNYDSNSVLNLPLTKHFRLRNQTLCHVQIKKLGLGISFEFWIVLSIYYFNCLFSSCVASTHIKFNPCTCPMYIKKNNTFWNTLKTDIFRLLKTACTERLTYRSNESNIIFYQFGCQTSQTYTWIDNNLQLKTKPQNDENQMIHFDNMASY